MAGPSWLVLTQQHSAGAKYHLCNSDSQGGLGLFLIQAGRCLAIRNEPSSLLHEVQVRGQWSGEIGRVVLLSEDSDDLDWVSWGGSLVACTNTATQRGR